MTTINKKVVWRSTAFFPSKVPPPAGSKVQSIEKTLAYTSVAFATGFVAGTLGTWIGVPGLPLPLPATESLGIDNSYLTHFSFWVRNTLWHLPIFNHYYQEPHDVYEHYKDLLAGTGYSYTLWTRKLAGYALGGYFSYKAFFASLKNQVDATPEEHKRGMRLLKSNEAHSELQALFEKEAENNKPKGNYAELAKGVWWPWFRFVTHSMIVGAAGTGKSQLMVSMMEASMNAKLKSFFLDPKYEFTKGYYNPETSAILDATDERSYVWDIAKDLKNLSDIKKFASALIPQKGNDPIWANAARAVFTGMIVYLKKTIVDKEGKPCYTWVDISDMVTLKPSQLVHIMQDCHPEAMTLIADIDEETGEISTNQTSFGIMVNLLSFMGGIRDLSRFWYGNDQKKISLYQFMTDDNYQIKTIFAKPNDTEGEMSNGLLRAALVYCMSLIDSPALSESKVPKIAFYLDEIHSVGKLENEIGAPLISRAFDRGRSKGISMNITCQSLNQLVELYNDKIVDGWREASSNFYLTGTPLGKTADSVASSLGERAIDKTHTSVSFQDSGVSKSVQTQTHNDKVLFASELSSELTLTATGIKFYYQGRGLPNVYILDKPYVDIPDLQPHWIERIQKQTAVNPNSRVLELIKKSMSGETDENPESSIERFNKLDQEYADLDDAPDFNDYGQYSDEPQEDISKKAPTEYDVTEDESDDDIANDVIKDKITEIMFDSHTINAMKQIWELLSSKNKRVKTTNIYEKVAYDNKKRYKSIQAIHAPAKEKETA